MANTYYDSELTGAQIEQALTAIDGLIVPSNNGKIVAVQNGRLVAKSASEFSGETVLEPLSVTANGDYFPGTGIDGFDEVHVSVPTGSTPVIQPLNVTQNGTYTAPSGVDGYSPVTVNVSGGTPNLQAKTTTENGIVLPDAGYDGLSQVTVNVSGGQMLIANWDFKSSLIDSVYGLEATLGGTASRDGNGVSIDGPTSYVSLPSLLEASARTYEVDIGSMQYAGNGHHRFFMFADSTGFIYRSSNVWSFYNGSWYNSEITDYDFFSNSTVKIFVDVIGYWHIYKDGVLVFEPPSPLVPSPTSAFYIGSINSSLYGAVIEGLRVY